MRRILLICPPFFSYHRSIIEELERQGDQVVWWNDRTSDHPVYKILLRLFPAVITKWSEAAFAKLILSLDAAAVDTVLVIKGEALSPQTVKAIRAKLPTARFVYYLWDGIENIRGALNIAGLFDRVATFDPLDAQRFSWQYRPLFARNIKVAPIRESASCRYDWSFIGTLHSDRYRVLQRLINANASLRFFAFGFFPSRLVRFFKAIVDWSLWRSGPVQISFKPISTSDIQAIVDESRAVVDIEHPRQRGLTMRTIETLLSRNKLITTNRHILDADLYDSSRVCMIDRDHPKIPPEFLMSEFSALPASVSQRYTLKSWLTDLIN